MPQFWKQCLQKIKDLCLLHCCITIKPCHVLFLSCTYFPFFFIFGILSLQSPNEMSSLLHINWTNFFLLTVAALPEGEGNRTWRQRFRCGWTAGCGGWLGSGARLHVTTWLPFSSVVRRMEGHGLKKRRPDHFRKHKGSPSWRGGDEWNVLWTADPASYGCGTRGETLRTKCGLRW
jgi:hypothetical protein